jgi:Rne/Rng family ribonuclease
LATAALPVVTLASGARLVVEPTAAATAIDIDSASAAGGSGAPLAVNLEAATEVARQLRLRDLGGIVVVDFLRLPAPRLRDQIVNALRKAVASDRRRVEVLGWTRAGLCELTRMRGRLPATLD